MFRSITVASTSPRAFRKWAARRNFARALRMESLEERRVMAYDTAVLADGPVGYYRLDELAGPTIDNAVVGGADATAGVDPTYGVAGAFDAGGNTAFDFDGVDDYLALPDSVFGAYPNPAASLSIEVWFKTSSSGVIFSQTDAGATPGGAAPVNGQVPALYVGSDGKLYASTFWHNSVTLVTESLNAVDDGQWHHAVVTYTGSTTPNSGVQRLYVDGVLQDTLTGLTQQFYNFTGDYDYFLGTGHTGGSWAATSGTWEFFAGSLDEFAVYNRAITAAEVSDHYLQATAVTVDLDGNTVITGTGGDDRITLTTTTNNGVQLRINNTVINNITVAPLMELIINGGDGNDTIFSAGANYPVTVNGGNGNDYISAGATDDTLNGDAGADRIFGGDGLDTIDGGADNDSVDGGAGNDILFGGLGNDTLQGGLGNDTVSGEDGLDTVSGGAGNDILDGGGDNDLLDGGADNDVLYGANGNDKLYAGTGNDIVVGGDGADVVYGGGGEDLVTGEDFPSSTAEDIAADYALGWFSGANLPARIANVPSLVGDLSDDAELDTLFGDAGRDWFIYNPLVDKAKDFNATINNLPNDEDELL